MTTETKLNIDGFDVRQRDGHATLFFATSDTIEILFESYSLEGRNYCKIHWVYDLNTDKVYRAQRYHHKYIALISKISGHLYTNYYKKGITKL